MDLINKIKKWPIEKKRIFSISVALFFTILIIILGFNVSSVWKDEATNTNLNKDNLINSIQKSISEIFDKAKPILDQAFSSSTQKEEETGQINSISSSFSTTSNIVR